MKTVSDDEMAGERKEGPEREMRMRKIALCASHTPGPTTKQEAHLHTTVSCKYGLCQIPKANRDKTACSLARDVEN